MATTFKKSIENVYRNMITYSIITEVLTVIMGCVLFFLPNASNKVIGILVGIIILVNGLNAIYKYFKRDGAKIFALNFVFGILYAILGLVIIIYPFTVVEFVTVSLGLFVVVNAASKINYGLWLKRGNEDAWLITLVSGILLLIIGILIIFNPFASLTLTRLAGVFLILTGILEFTDTILFKNRAKEIMEIFW